MVAVNQVGTIDCIPRRQEVIGGRYRIERALSAGSGGEVFLAEDLAKGEKRALKLLPAHFAAARAQAEFGRLSELSHPSIVRILDAGVVPDGTARGRGFLVTPYLDGPPLAESLPTAPEARCVRFALAAEALSDALAYLHGRGVLHGDISPANVRCDKNGRPFLIDFGLTQMLTSPLAFSPQTVAGTLGFIAPEVMLGERGPSGDIFALGATLYDAWTGVPPFGLGREALRRVWQGPPPSPSSLHPGLSPVWDDILLAMIAAGTEARPSSARELLQQIRRVLPDRPARVEMDLTVPFPAGDPFAGILVGRREEEGFLRHHLDQLAQEAATVSLICVVGSPGSGRHALIGRALREARLVALAQASDAIAIDECESTDLMARVAAQGERLDSASPLDPAGRASERRALVIEELERRASARPLCLALAGSPEDEALALAVANGPPSGRLLVLLPCDHLPGRLAGTADLSQYGVAVVTLGPLGRDAITELIRRGTGRETTVEMLDWIVGRSAGLAAAAVLLIRRWMDAEREGMPLAVPTHEPDRDLAQLLDVSFAALSEAARTVVLATALFPAKVGDAPAVSAHAAETGSEEAQREACAAGWLRTGAPGLPSEAHAAALWRALACSTRLQALAESAAPALPEGDARLAEVQLALGQRVRAAQTFWQAMRDAATRMAWSRVAGLGLRAIAAGTAGPATADALLLANALGMLGRYDEALAILDGCDARNAVAAIAERQAWLLGRRGDAESGRRLLEQALKQLPEEGSDAQLLRARLARTLVASGRYAEAFAVAQPALKIDSPAGTAAREAAVLALAHAGQLEAAQEILDALAATAGRASETTLAPRVQALAGLLRQLAGRPLEAAEAYRSAAEGYGECLDRHGAASATFNLGCALAESGDYGGAVTALERATRELGRLGAQSDYALAVFNIGALFLQLGDLAAATRASERLGVEVRGSHLEGLLGHVQLLAAELDRRRQAFQKAMEGYATAAQEFTRVGMRTLAATAMLGQAETLAEEGRVTEARVLFRDVMVEEGVAASAGDSPLSLIGEWLAVTRGRIELADRAAQAGEVRESARTLADAAAVAKMHGRLPAAWRMASLAARLFGRVADSRRDASQDLAVSIFEEVKMRTPMRYWSGLGGDGDAQALAQHAGDGGTAVLAGRAALLDERLRRLLRINKRLNSELRLARVLETIIDTVIELTDAERGFLLLKDGSGELVVKVARNIDQTTLEGDGTSLSRTIAKQAADTGQPVVTVDAVGDTRFSEQLSVSDLHLRSVLAVPLAVKGAVVGTLYVDHRLRKGVFGEDEVAMVLDFAEQGAIAIENARLISELRRREQQVQSLNRRLERELRAQEAALSAARVELKESRQVAALRYDYRQIVGQSPAMLDLFRLLDRVTDSHLPVVIEGESGTGKELVARAIHFNGPRKDKAFVSENCAAIPETLLESALFGHVRGAFTGADREARGLFAIAHGGTLFLDEVGDMSPAMQGKLLRVLQDGVFHRVGGERPEKVDVRVLVASNRNLGQLVEDGKFRKDLFYRLSVIRLFLPPLRERREDIPLLLRHFLERFATETRGEVKGLEPTALARLAAYTWPGNVRELENEIAKSATFSGSTISVSDLSPHIQAGQDPSEANRNEPDSLRLRQRVERLERQLIREAMNRSEGNQTRASALLGLSRYGLQKKLRRYSLG